MKKLNKSDMENIFRGAQILAGGGGGDISWARELMTAPLNQEKEIIVKNADEIPQDSLIAIIGIVGGGIAEEENPVPYLLESISGDIKEPLEKPVLKAIRELTLFLGREPDGFIPTEIGAGNMAVTLMAGAMTGKFVINGDCCGRAKPLISISTTRIGELAVTPMIITNPLGDTVIIKEVLDDTQAEHIARQMAVISGGDCCCIRCPHTLADYKKGMIFDSFTRCERLGEVIINAEEKGFDAVESILAVEEKSQVLFRGKIISWEKERKGGFITGWLNLLGDREYAGHTYSIWFKNEFLAGYMDETRHYKCPDIIAVVNEKTCMGLSNWSEEEFLTDPITVIGIPAPEIWKTPKGLEIFSFDTLGFNGVFRKPVMGL